MSSQLATNHTRERILHVAYNLLLKQGYNGTGLKQILDEAQVPKGSFYHYFKSKEDLAAELIKHYQKVELHRWREAYISSQGNRLEQIQNGLNETITKYSAEPEQQFGCLLAALSGELAFTTPALRKAIDDANRSIIAAITSDIAEGQQQGVIRNDIGAATLAELLWSAWQGATLRVRISRSVAPLVAVVSLLMTQFYPSAAETNTQS